jgi:NAD-dependent dihydropyrimidine dehydrogenase PreA subunit
MSRARAATQLAFLALVLGGVFLVRGHAEQWCPFGGVEGLYGFVRTGTMPCSLGAANLYILGGVLLAALILRRAFCSHACPIGALSEWTRRGAARLGIRPRRVPHRLDRWFSLLQYAVLAVLLYFTWRTSELIFRGFDPCYALISRHGEDITAWAYLSGGAILLGSLVVSLPFCRWLCPLAAVFHPFSRFGWLRIRRDPKTCTDCGACARDCPMEIPVQRRETVREAHCTACLECVAACPAREQGAIAATGPGRRRRVWPQAAVIAVLVAVLAAAVAAAQVFPRASFTHQRGAPPEGGTATVELRVTELNCRGRANLLVYFMDRDDLFAVPGYVKLEAWPAPESGRLRVTYDPAQTGADAVRRAITEPYYDPAMDRWQASPFGIPGP